MNTNITLAHGNGGAENAELIHKIFFKNFKNEILEKNEDAAVIEEGKLAFTTDSFTISPIFFSGGDIGKISICGTTNDLAMMGAKPKYISCGVIIEEGFPTKDLEQIVLSMKKELEVNGAIVVSGDTKVVPKGSIDKIFINTTGIGEIQQSGISSNNLEEDDVIIVSNQIGKHGATIFAQREGIDISSDLISDCASLWPVVEKLIQENIKISAMRDATRGGLAAVLNEWANQNSVCIEVDEGEIPVCQEVQGICELLGFEAYNLANEGTFVIAVKKEFAQKTLELLHSFPLSKEAKQIATISSKYPNKVVLNSQWGTKRFMDMPSGELLPRIC